MSSEEEIPKYIQTNLSLEELDTKVKLLIPDPKFPHDPFVIASLEEALSAAKEGNFGVGAVLVDPSGKIVVRGHNHVFHPYFRSDIHAEMDTMTKFEEQNKDIKTLKGYSLYTSLEPCPMCLTRLITSGVNKVFHAAEDVETGMVSRLNQLTQIWVEMAKEQEFAPARCSPEFRNLALEIFLYTATRNTEILQQRRR